jgi:hypothetical protein
VKPPSLPHLRQRRFLPHEQQRLDIGCLR